MMGNSKDLSEDRLEMAVVNPEQAAREQSSNPDTAFVLSLSREEYASIEKHLKRKLDIRLMAPASIIYILNFLDRNNIAAAGTAGIAKSLNLSSTQYETAVSILFVGYVLMQVPSNIFLAQMRPSLYLPGCMVAWGTLSTCTAAVQSAGGLYAVRFLLGLIEAAYYPGSLFLISSWYRRSEMGFRCALLYSGSQIGSAFSGLIAAGITSGLDGAQGIPAWRWIFIIEGSITMAIAIIAFFILPDYPSNTSWLTPEEKAVAQWRLMEDAGQADEYQASWGHGFKLAFVDWRMYIFALIFLGIMVSTATQNFFPTVVGTLGYGRTRTLLLTAPPYLVGAVISIANNLSADKFKNSSYHIIWPLVIAITGFVIGASTLNTGARYFSMFLMISGGHGANALLVAWAQKTMLRPRMKRAAAVAFVNSFGNLAQVFASYLYRKQDAPRFTLAMSVNAGFALFAILLTFLMRLTLLRANKRLASEDRVVNAMVGTESNQDVRDGPDKEALARRMGFRYIA